MPFDLERKDKGNIDIEKIANREFGSNEFMIGFDKGVMDKVAGRLKGGQWKKHIKKFKGVLRR